MRNAIIAGMVQFVWCVRGGDGDAYLFGYNYAIIHLARKQWRILKKINRKKKLWKKNGTIKCYLVRMQDNVNGAPPAAAAACSLMFAINNYCLRQNVCARAAHGKFRAAYHFFSSYMQKQPFYLIIFFLFGCVKIKDFWRCGRARANLWIFNVANWAAI